MENIIKKMIFLTLFFFNLNYSKTMENLWTEEYEKTINGHWGKTESISGPGSSLEQTTVIRKELPAILNNLKITSILDLPCGDFNWMRFVNLGNCMYIGADVVATMIKQNNSLYGNERRKFLHLDVTKDILPTCDLIICRDLLVHLSTKDVYIALTNFKQSGAKYLLATTFISKDRQNIDFETGSWQPINLQGQPFNFPEPDLLINEQCTEQNGIYNDKSLGLWRLETLVIPSSNNK